MADSRSSSFRRDLVSAYVASGARVLSWVWVSAIVYRVAGADAFALLALIRATIGVLNYTSLGLLPAMIQRMSGQPGVASLATVAPPASGLPIVLAYAREAVDELDPRIHAAQRSVYSTGLTVAVLTGIVGAVVIWLYAGHVGSWLACRMICGPRRRRWCS